MKKIIYALIMCIFLTFSYSINASASILGVKGRVLFLSSYSYSWDTVQMQIDGIKNTLGAEYELDYEYMDTKRVNDVVSMQLFYEGLAYRMSQVPAYDVIIVGDDAALQFVLNYRTSLFKGIPVVFEGVNDEALVEEALKDPLITGIIEKLSLEDNLDLALELLPDANTVVAVLDDSVTGEAERKRFYAAKEQYPELIFDELNASELSSIDLQRRLRALGKNTILLFIVMTEDADGVLYNSQQVGSFMLTYSSVPTFRMVEAGIGNGFLGGNVVSMYKSGEEAAKMAKAIIGGTPVSEIEPMMESPSETILDEDIMRRYEMDLGNIPKGATLINHKAGFVESNKEAMGMIICLIIAIVLIIVWVVLDNIKKYRMMKELREAKRIMENASQHDFLTGLANRSKFMEDLQEIIQEEKPCTVLMLDVDDFKMINDTYGHTAGDTTLQEIANRMKEMQSQILTPYRYAGDEFIIILRSSQPKLVEKAAYDCRNVFAKEIKFTNANYRVTGSIGVASYPRDALDIETLITCADDAMYEVKKSGKNMFAYYKRPEKQN
ncbi:MAG: diguanylate cyclase [Lachnospiraceae bacterium]|nr:diguanylate cyclase [Lachnospiraceae bacterium]MBQ7777135.1 diguanylate cyclase [Lachnospiraceae bacterium]